MKGRTAAEQGVQNAAQSPHVDGFGIPFVLYDLWCGVADGAARGSGVFLPDNLAQAKVGNLHLADPAASDLRNELALIFLLLVVRPRLRMLGRDDRNGFEEKILWFDVTVHDALLLVQIPDATGNLEDDVPCELLWACTR